MHYSSKKILTALFSIAFSFSGFSQLETNWWYFGTFAGMDFTSGSPVAVNGGQINQLEGCASISDASGNRLFYTDGMTVWNKNHVVMGNGTGLLGNSSSTQSGVIVQKPGSTTIYYIFTTDAQAGANGLRWSEVDMTLNAGLGGVTANKNMPLYTPTDEKICGIRHCNNTDVWVVTHDWNSNQFRSYLVTSAGINPVPVLSSAGTVHSGSNAMTIGYMKVSPAGNKLALAIRYQSSGAQPGYFELFDFNNSSGAVSNPVNLGSYTYTYGMEFSPNGQMLYGNSSQPGRVIQWNMCAGTSAQIVASATVVGNSVSGWVGSLQVGRDGKIYMARYQSANVIGVINSPNTLGVGCNYVDNGFSVAPNNSQFGLPNFIAKYLYTPPSINSVIHANINCLLDSLSFTTTTTTTCTSNNNNNIVSVSWNFGDPNSGPNNTSTLLNPVHTFSASGTYTITLTVNFTCYSSTVTYVVTTQNCGPTVTAANQQICLGNCTTLTAIASGGTSPYTYQWNPSAQTTQTATGLCPTATTVYTISITDAMSATSSATVSITVSPPPTITTASTAPLCNGGTGTATATPSGGSAFSYSWNPSGQTTQTATGLASGTYTVTVTNNMGCSQTATVQITQPPPLTASITFNNPACTACNGTANATPSGGTSGYTYSWNNGQTTQTATGLCAGTYTVTVKDANNCTTTATVTLTANVTTFSSTTSQNNITCNLLCNGTSTVTPTAGNSPYTYSWNTTPVQTTANATGLCAGTYSVLVTDLNGCTSTASVTITQPPALSVNATGTNPMCAQCNGSANATPSGGTSGYSFSWNTTPVQTTQNATGLCAGNYTVTVTDINGCTATTSVTMISTTGTFLVTQGAITSPSCSGGCNGSASVNPSGTSPYTYSWNTTPVQTTQNATGLCAGTYSVQVTDVNGCTGTFSVTITQPTPVAVTTSGNASVCTGSSIGINSNASGGTSGYTYVWNPGPVNGQNISVTPTANTTYTVTATDQNGCTATQTLTVTVNPLPVVQFAPDVTSGCSPVCVTFTNTTTGATNCMWTFGDGGNSTNCNPTYCYNTPGTYNVTLTVTDNNGCTNSLTQNNLISVYPWAVAAFTATPQPTDIFNSTIHFFNQSSGTTWLWNFGDSANTTSTQSNPAFNYNSPGTYIVTLIVNNQYNCPDTVTMTIVIEDQYALYVPNAFTPNGDNLNNVFLPSGVGIDPNEYELLIFDRWGNLIFKTNDVNTGWDGRANGGKDIAQEDVYVWKINTRSTTDGRKHTYIGHVSLIK